MLRKQANIKEEDFLKVVSCEVPEVKAALTDLENNQLKAVLKIWKLHEPESWDYIELVQAFYLEEWRLLEKARKELRRGWRRVYAAYVASTKTEQTGEVSQ
jgi:hypothetical protein